MKMSAFKNSLATRESVVQLPKLSAAITTPSLNLTARTEVPVTIGDFVCV